MLKAFIVRDAITESCSFLTRWMIEKKMRKFRFAILIAEENDVLRDSKGKALRFQSRKQAVDAAERIGILLLN